jgi:hypothetical protein
MSTQKRNNTKKISAKDFDQAFDDGDISDFLEPKSIKVKYPMQRISIDFTQNILEDVDQEAARVGVTRTSLIKIWIAERLAASKTGTAG